ncbi:NAD(P)H-dependent oxidoreductase [Endozoicomonas sp. Mp262]|uniref:NADPH-dependent FMN reductase n=1 Tax=Endozoicomonas sp. Mp262 TaxID=2919499 RepID=UPI0021D92320
MKLLAFAASNSTHSINKQLVTYAASLLGKTCQIEVLDLNDFELPLFSEDKEKELGQPELAHSFLSKISNSDAVITSFAEHNGSYSVAYKNIFDWCSRITPKVFDSKPVILLSTSPGARGGAMVMEIATKTMPRFGAQVKASLSIPSFYENFDPEKRCLKNKDLQQQLEATVNCLLDE